VTQVEGDVKTRAEQRIGALLRDKWRIDELIGLGGMAAVYSATHRNGKRAAVKILHPEAAMVPDIRARFLREGYLANKVEHPGAVSILDDDVDIDGTVFLVMELLSGQTLEAVREGGGVAVEDLLLVAHRALDVLAVAHDRKIVHRDLKPANVFVCSDGAVKILDFGIARLNTPAQTPSGATGRDTALGTPGYMPPEQARGRWDDVDGQSDVWSLGATLFAVLAGRPVHQSGTLNEQLLAAMTLPAPPLSSVAPDAPHEVALLVDRALAFEKAERFRNARAMQAEVARVFETLTGKPIATASPMGMANLGKGARPGAPTLAATNHAVPKPEPAVLRRVSPVRGLLIGLGAALVFGLLGFIARSSHAPTASPSATTASGARAAPLTAQAYPSELPVAQSPRSTLSAVPPPLAVSAVLSAEPRAGAAPKPRVKGPARVVSAPKASTSAPAADPFTRRK
jgi:serine/threonine protein kinase